MAYSCVRVQFEIGHEASIRNKRTPEGFTHDWEVFVRGIDNAEIHHFIDKVVFQLHDTFPKPKRVVKEPPYCVKESGYAGFNLPIDIYFKGKGEDIRKLRFYYDLTLQSSGPRISNFVREKADFSNPSEEFRRKLLKGGGIGIGNDGANSLSDKGSNNNNLSSIEDKKSSPLTSKPKLSNSGDTIKKHKIKDATKQDDIKNSNSFAALFGPPIKTSKHSPTNSKPSQPKVSSQLEKSSHDKQPKDVTKSSKHSPHKEKDREGKESAKKDKDLDRSSSKEKDRIKEKDGHRDKDKNKEKQIKKPTSPLPIVKIPKEEALPKKSMPEENKDKTSGKSDFVKVEKKHKEKKAKDGSKEKKEKHSKEHHEKKDQEKEKVHEKPEKKVEPFPKEMKVEVAPPKPSKTVQKSKTGEKERDRSCDLEKQRHKHKKKDKHREEERERQNKKEEKLLAEAVKEKPKSPSPPPIPPQPTSHMPQQPQKQAVRPLNRLLEELQKNPRTDKDSDSDLSISNDEDIKYSKPQSVPPQPQPQPQAQPQPQPHREPTPPHPKQARLRQDDPRNGRESKEEKPRKRDRKLKDEEKESRKRKRKMKEKEEPEEKVFKPEPKEDSSRSDRSSPVGKSCDSRSPSPETLFTDDYVTQLKDLQHKIMTLQDNADLQRVVQVISETGQFEITQRTFDFDLCALDPSTVKRLQDMFVAAS